MTQRQLLWISGICIVTFHAYVTMQARQALTIPAAHLAELHGIKTITIKNLDDKECLVPQDSAETLPAVEAALKENLSVVNCGEIPNDTLESIAQALWSIYYARNLSAFDILQHMVQDTALPWLSAQEIAHIQTASQLLNFDLLARLAPIPMISLVSKKLGEKTFRVVVPLEQAMKSNVLKNNIMKPEFTDTHEIEIHDISANTLKLLAQIMWAAHEYNNLTGDALFHALSDNIALTKETMYPAVKELLKASFLIEFEPAMTFVSQYAISNSSEAQVTGIIQEMSGFPTIKLTLIQQMDQLKKWGHMPGEEQIKLSLKEKWHTHQHELLTSRIKGTRFDFSDIHLTSIEGIHHIPNIHLATELIMADNKIHHVDVKDISHLQQLRMLDLSFNNLTYIDTEHLVRMPSLQTIKLRGNQFSDQTKQEITKALTAKKIDIYW